MNKTIHCLDCETTVKIRDKHNEIELEAIQHCPLCGSTEIEVSEK